MTDTRCLRVAYFKSVFYPGGLSGKRNNYNVCMSLQGNTCIRRLVAMVFARFHTD